jgi:hypothetical protein
MLIEVAVGLGPLRSLECSRTLASAMGTAIGFGKPIVLLPFGSLSQRSQIDHVSHAVPRVKPDTWAFGPDGPNSSPPITPRPWRGSALRLATDSRDRMKTLRYILLVYQHTVS